METQPKLFQITQTTGMSYSTAVQSTCGTIVKHPSPGPASPGRAGAASLPPSAPATPDPIPENPHELSHGCGRPPRQNCLFQLWPTPTSQQIIPFRGVTDWESATTRPGRIGVAC